MAEPFDINLTEGAQADLDWFEAYAQRIIIDGLKYIYDINRQLAVAKSYR